MFAILVCSIVCYNGHLPDLVIGTQILKFHLKLPEKTFTRIFSFFGTTMFDALYVNS